MKKLFAVFFAGALVAGSLTACVKGTENKEPEEETPSTTVVGEAPKVYYQNPLNGEEQELDYPWGQRPVAVMVNNIMANSVQTAWPQRGLSDADIIFEMETEGGITRSPLYLYFL